VKNLFKRNDLGQILTEVKKSRSNNGNPAEAGYPAWEQIT
jgi:hypothetical protein